MACDQGDFPLEGELIAFHTSALVIQIGSVQVCHRCIYDFCQDVILSYDVSHRIYNLTNTCLRKIQFQIIIPPC